MARRTSAKHFYEPGYWENYWAAITLAEEQAALTAKRLTRREWEIAELVTEGLTNYQIAVKLGLSAQTVKNHVNSILVKMEVGNRVEVAGKINAINQAKKDEVYLTSIRELRQILTHWLARSDFLESIGRGEFINHDRCDGNNLCLKCRTKEMLLGCVEEAETSR